MFRRIINKTMQKCDVDWILPRLPIAGGLLGGLSVQYVFVNKQNTDIPDWICGTLLCSTFGAFAVPTAVMLSPILIPSLAVSYGGLKLMQFYKDYNDKYVTVQICDKHEGDK